MNGIVTPGGRFLGRKPDKPDDRDRRFLDVHPDASNVPLPPAVDLRRKLPPCFDQSRLGSCGPNAGDGLMCFLFPQVGAQGGFSRLQIYYDVRTIEGSVQEDSGVETRDVLKTLANTGAAPESLWPYRVEKFIDKPSDSVYSQAAKYKLKSYSRLRSGSNYLQCLASGFPFLLGVELFESFESAEFARHGIMPMPQPGEKMIGGHDVLVVGYILNFKSDPLFLASGVDPATTSDEVLIVRNSWGTIWSHHFRGNFFMPLPYALDGVRGDDAWTGRI
jgi:C1A family cysteine protease